MTGHRSFRIEATASDAGERLDRMLAARLAAEGLSRARIEGLIDGGAVQVASRTVKRSMKVREGDAIVVEVTPLAEPNADPEDIPIDIVFEDADLLVVNKPSGLVVHPAKGHASGTLVNAVRFHAEVDEDDAPLRPGIVHRLDKDTSGLLVVAKTSKAREGLAALFAAHEIERSYLALVTGNPPSRRTFDTLHGRHPKDRKRFTSRVTTGRRAVTHVEVVERFADGLAAWVRCTLETGRTHQIRMHLAEAGFSVLADETYGRRPRDPALRDIADALGRHALHAAVLGFVHPITGRAVRFEVAPPDDFLVALQALRELRR